MKRIFACTTAPVIAAMIAGAPIIFTGCSTERDAADLFAPEDVGTLVVDGLLIVDQQFPDILLSRAQAPGTPFDPAAAAESYATVAVRNLSTNRVIRYVQDPMSAGRYVTSAPDTVKPETTYELTIVTPSRETVRATTTTPGRFTIDEWLLLDDTGQNIRQRLRTFEELGDSVYYAPENQLVYADGLLEARFSRPIVPAFQVGILSLDLDSDFVIDPDFFEEDDFADLERNVASPPLEALDGSVRLPWFAIFFQERYKLRVLALDDNTYDLVRSTPDDSGGLGFGGNFGDSFQRPIFHIDGGIGLFGSAAADSIGFFILPRP